MGWFVMRPPRSSIKGAACCWVLHPEEQPAEDWKRQEGMSSHMAVANKEQPAVVRRTKIRFWEDGPSTHYALRMPNVTTKGINVHSHHRSTAGNERVTASAVTVSGLSPCGAGLRDGVFHLPPRYQQ